MLAGDGTYSNYCCVHPYGQLRLILTFEPGLVIVIAAGYHSDEGFYKALADDLGTSVTGQKRESKPKCCGDSGWPSVGSVTLR